MTLNLKSHFSLVWGACLALLVVTSGCGKKPLTEEEVRQQFRDEVVDDGICINIVFKGEFPGYEETSKKARHLSDALVEKRLGVCGSFGGQGSEGTWNITAYVNDLDRSVELINSKLKEIGLSENATIYKWQYEPLENARKFSSLSSKDVSPQIKRDLAVIALQYAMFIDAYKKRPKNQADLRSLENPSFNTACWEDYLAADKTGDYEILYLEDGYLPLDKVPKTTIVAYRRKPLEEGFFVAYSNGTKRLITESDFEESMAELKKKK